MFSWKTRPDNHDPAAESHRRLSPPQRGANPEIAAALDQEKQERGETCLLLTGRKQGNNGV